jgi:hypothetical protein
MMGLVGKAWQQRPAAGPEGVANSSELFQFVVGAGAETDPEDQASVAEMVKGRRFPGHLVDSASRKRGHEGVQPDVPGPGGDRAERHPRVGDGSD